MKSAPSMAPVFAVAYLKMTEVARMSGYALALHGTMARDLDLIAVPWTEEAVPPDALADAMAKAIGGWTPSLANTGEVEPTPMPTKRPHGRLCWLIYWAGASCGYIDLSVMPLVPVEPTKACPEWPKCPRCGDDCAPDCACTQRAP